MSELREYLRKKAPHIHSQNCVDIIKAYDEFKKIKSGTYCEICLKKFTPEEKIWSEINVSPMHFYSSVCKEHYEHAMKPNLPGVRKELGISELDIEKKYAEIFEL